jgi:hypothetical protein
LSIATSTTAIAGMASTVKLVRLLVKTQLRAKSSV